MATLAALGRMSGRLNRRRLAGAVVTPRARGFRTSAAALAAQNFTMPALSPTMTEGNIATWRVKEGDKFSAGDVLLEIETDKATMDVEAQDEGVLMKIMQGDGAKAVKVGARIAVLAEEGDDISALEIPPDESAAKETPQKQPKSEASLQPPRPSNPTPAQPAAEATKKAPSGKPSRVIYPLLPSVAQLVKEKGIDESAVAQIVPTGPNGRLLKGDILAHLGVINQQTPATISERFEKLSHLDLSNIKLAKPAPKPQNTAAAAAAAAGAPAPKRPTLIEVSLPVSFNAALKMGRKLRDSIAINVPISEYIERASIVANDALPVPADYQPTADELFDQVLGLAPSNGPVTSRGNYKPQVTEAMEPRILKSSIRRRPDIIDVLAGPSSVVRRPALRFSSSSSPPSPAPTPSRPLFVSLTVPKAEEKRAKAFLERFKVVIEDEVERIPFADD